MSADADPHPDEEQPLDPAVERIRRKMMFLLMGSMGVMILGVFAVFAVILYRIGALPGSDGPAGAPTVADIAEPIALPAGARVADMVIGDGMLVVRIDLADGRQEVRFFRIGEDDAAGRIKFVPGGG